ncbi:hypothetical protein B296_00055450 [Ensete ventricosum]|uniref:Uncharacterized protein n=1 Tax=Ensete ventricosum TaxID=4639 RepID=A0A426X045_ENSVE|nr:hypothetical protein B296_00055450 [Ensete ventricosum]
MLYVAAEGCDQQRQHSDARAKRHRERDRGSGTMKEEVAVNDRKGEEVAVTQRRKAIATVATVHRSIGGRQSALIPY